jgi:hypothetical protein
MPQNETNMFFLSKNKTKNMIKIKIYESDEQTISNVLNF